MTPGPDFPRLTAGNHRVTSPPSPDYNCIAWAAGDTGNWWWPDLAHEDFWPAGVDRVATVAAFREAFEAARPCLLEPIYEVEVRVPEDCMGAIIGDLSSHRGKILGMDTDDGMQVVRAHIPQKELYHYSSRLRSLTGGRGIHKEKLSHYEEMPKELEAKVIAESKKPVEA